MRKRRIICLFMMAALCLASMVPWMESNAADSQKEMEVKSLAANLNYTFTSIDEKPVSTAAGSSSATVLIFGKTTCGNTIGTMRSISGSTWVKDSGIRTVFAEVNQASKADVAAFAQSYGCASVTFCYDEGYSIASALWDYVDAGSVASQSIILPVIVLVDRSNMIQKVMTGYHPANDIITEINRFKDTAQPSAPDTSAPGNSAPAGAAKEQTAPAGSVVTDLKTKSVCKVTSSGSSGCTVEYVRASNKKSTSVTVPAAVVINGRSYTVTSIASNAFKGNKKLKSVTIGKNVKKVGKNTFYGCKNLKKIVVRSSNLSKKNIGKNAFKGIYAKAVVKVPKSKVKSYKSLFRSKGLGKKANVKKL